MAHTVAVLKIHHIITRPRLNAICVQEGYFAVLVDVDNFVFLQGLQWNTLGRSDLCVLSSLDASFAVKNAGWCLRSITMPACLARVKAGCVRLCRVTGNIVYY